VRMAEEVKDCAGSAISDAPDMEWNVLLLSIATDFRVSKGCSRLSLDRHGSSDVVRGGDGSSSMDGATRPTGRRVVQSMAD
jgi:hypothetical protein